MPNFKDLGTSIVDGISGEIPGPLGDLVRSKHSRHTASFPSDIEGMGQRHFIRFNIVTKTGTSFGQMVKSGNLPTVSAAGERFGSMVDEGLETLQGFADRVPGLPDEITKNATELINGASSAFDEGLAGITTSVESTIGQLSEQASKFRESVAESVPTQEDALKGLGDFAGSIGGVAAEFAQAIQGTTKSEGDIVLYMPFNINETYQADWRGGEMGLLGTVLGGGLRAQVANKDFAGALETLNSQASLTNAAGLGTEMIGGIAGSKLSEIGGKLGIQKTGGENLQAKMLKEQGLAINPHWELFFEGVQPRVFTFDFKMSPKNATEAESIQQIVQMFKTYAAPPAEVDGSRRYWGYPSMFEIEYWNSQKLHRLKPCALQNITVNYSGDGTNHTFYDGRPMQTDITLTFMESELLTRQDMKEGY